MLLQWLPENISTYGLKIDHVIEVIYYIVGAWFILAEALLFYFLIKYRRSSAPKAIHIKGNTFKSLSFLLVPVVLVAGFDVGIDLIQEPVWHEIKIDRPINPDVTVRVMAKQFAFDFVYTGPDGTFDTADDIVSPGEFKIPVNKKIVIEMESKDVIHSFWVPNLRLKQDIVPGRRIKGWFEAIKTGSYGIGCAELCGFGHGTMHANLSVVDNDAFTQWLKDKEKESGEW